MKSLLLLALGLAGLAGQTSADTVALWLFDEPAGLYPSTPLDSSAGLDAPLVLGPGGSVVPGRFGRALSTVPYPATEIPATGESTAALGVFPRAPGRTQDPLTWRNAGFTALMTGGENHLRKEVSFVNPTDTDLNLGDFDWTVEFWFRARSPAGRGVVLELGSGPRAENDRVTRLTLDAAGRFVWENPGCARPVELPVPAALVGDPAAWHHYAFTYRADAHELALFADGRKTATARDVAWQRLPHGDEAYLTLGRDARWGNPLPGALDELRVSRGVVYPEDFPPPGSFAPPVPAVTPAKGAPLLFAPEAPRSVAVPLGDRKYLFLDGALVERSESIRFVPHPPRRIDRVIDGTEGMFRKHLTVVEDESGLIRIYNGGPDDFLMVHTSRDGLHFEDPDTGLHHKGRRNIVIAEPAPLGRPIIDPNGPPERRWKYVSGLEGRGVYLYTSPDGWKWTRERTAVLPFRSGSQSSFFYDDQRGVYVGYHRTGFPLSAEGGTQREFVMSEAVDLYHPWPVTFLSQEQVRAVARTRPLRSPQPWWLDNGPLTPGDFGVELPTVFAPDPRLDPVGSGVYVPKATKYPWAPDAYVAFPVMYFDYEQPKLPPTRRILMDADRRLGSGQVETQLAVSRDGVHWTRLPSPTYLPDGEYQGRHLHQIYIAEGLVRRGGEIWQYFYGQEEYHSPVAKNPAGNGVYRAVQRLDGFVSADAPYERLATLTTRPLTFTGNRLVLNLDTGGLGYAQVGLTEADGTPIPGFELERGVYLNGDFLAREVEWLGADGRARADVSSLAGRPVRLVFRMRHASLYALQFVQR
jgi:hypothetical protein